MKRILILKSVEHVVKKAKELGYTTIVVDKDTSISGCIYADYFKCINFKNLDECLQYAKQMNIDGVLSASDLSVIVAGYISTNLGLPGIDYETAKLSKDKFMIHKVLEKSYITNVPQYFKIQDLDVLKNLKREITFPVIVKPNDGLGSVGVTKVNNPDELLKSCSFAIEKSKTNTALIETFIEGKNYTVEAFSYNGKKFILGIIDKIMTDPPYYTSIGNIMPAKINSKIKSEIEKVVLDTIDALGINIGPINMDIIVNKDNKAYIIDIGARLGGNAIAAHIIPNSLEIDYIGNIIKVAMGESVDFNFKKHTCVVSLVLTLKQGKIRNLPDFNKYKNKNIVNITFNLKPEDIIEEYKDCSNPCGFIVAKAHSIEEAKAIALEIKDKIDNDIIRY